MSQELDIAYQARRRRLAAQVTAAAASAWGSSYLSRERALAAVVPIVEAGQRGTVILLDAYMASKAGAQPKGLNAAAYTTAAIRRLSAEEVYARPFGALGAHLAGGAELPEALASAQGSLERLVSTDLQLSQTHAARDWMADDDRVFGYRRVLGGGHNCSLCRSASTRIYYREDLMPIHERCSCTVEPLFGEHPGGLSIPSAAVRVVDDPEIGPRMLAESWAA